MMWARTGTSVMALDCHRTPTTSAVSTPTATSIFVIDSHCHLLTLCPDVRVTPKRWKAGRSTRLRPWKVHNIGGDRKSTRLNSSHLVISYAVFCLKKKKHKLTQYCSLP